MTLGKIVSANGHIDYVGQIYTAGEVAQPPGRDDYAFGTFVSLELEPRRRLVGLIYNTMLYNPEFGRLGPRLSPAGDLAVFSPDYLNEKVTLVNIMVIGLLRDGRPPIQGVPQVAASTDTLITRLSEAEITTFHRHGTGLQLVYLPLLLGQNTPLVQSLLRQVLNHLQQLFPAQSAALALLADDLAWRSQLIPLGGTIS